MDEVNRDFIEFVEECYGEFGLDGWNDVNWNFIEFDGEMCGEFGVVGKLI